MAGFKALSRTRTTGRSFPPTPPLSSSPFRVAEMQLKYLSKKTAQSPMPNLNHGGWWDWGVCVCGGGCLRESTHSFHSSSLHFMRPWFKGSMYVIIKPNKLWSIFSRDMRTPHSVETQLRTYQDTDHDHVPLHCIASQHFHQLNTENTNKSLKWKHQIHSECIRSYQASAINNISWGTFWVSLMDV